MTANEAWELMRELPKMNRDDLEEIYGTRDPWNVLIGYNPDEAQKELNDWKKKKEIQVGDEVEFDVSAGHRTLYITSYFGDQYYCGICKNGDTYCIHKSNLTKTGKHIEFDKIKDLIAANSEEKPKTNGDMIRAMSNDELVELFGDMVAGVNCRECVIYNNRSRGFACVTNCRDNFKDWLKQPAERSENNEYTKN